jgi:hypothetical protein
MTVTHTKIFHYKALKNLPKLVFLVCKYTIWQPCIKVQKSRVGGAAVSSSRYEQRGANF